MVEHTCYPSTQAAKTKYDSKEETKQSNRKDKCMRANIKWIVEELQDLCHVWEKAGIVSLSEVYFSFKTRSHYVVQTSFPLLGSNDPPSSGSPIATMPLVGSVCILHVL